MTTLVVKNLRAIPDARIDLSAPFTLLAGPNRAGKTSLMLALKACLSGTTAVLLGKPNLDCGGMCAEGATGEASAVLHDEKGSWVCRWSMKKTHARRSKHDPSELPKASATAAGCPSFLKLDAKARNDVFFGAFGIEPSKENLLSAIGESEVDADGEALWSDIQIQGWDDALKIQAEKLRELKAGWEAVTSEPWTTERGVDWAPVSGQEAVSDEVYDGLQKAALDLAEKAAAANAELAKCVIPASADNLMPCPCCEKLLHLAGGKLVEMEPAPKDEVEAAMKKRASLVEKEATLRQKAQTAERALIEADALRKRDDSKRDERIAEAKELDAQIRQQAPIVDLLGPDGVRATIRNQVIEMVNVRLAGLSDIMDLPPVTLEWACMPGKSTPTICASLGGRALFKLCTSERWIVSAIIQIAIAMGDDTTMILLDDAETCVGEYRENLARLAMSLDIQVVMAMSLANPSLPPDLKRAGLGQTYWVEDGRISELGDVLAAEMEAAA